MNLLIGITGSVAVIKLTEIIDELRQIALKKQIKLNIRVVATKNAIRFVPASFHENYKDIIFYTDDDEHDQWKQKGDPILHIELRRWADIFAICPLDANSMAKIALGLCDNTLTCVARCWDIKNNTLMIFPAMNTLMWEHPITAQYLARMEEMHIKVISPIEKLLACGDFGAGAMPSPEFVASSIIDHWQSLPKLS